MNPDNAEIITSAMESKGKEDPRIAGLASMRESLNGVSTLLDAIKADDVGMTYEQEMAVRLNPELSREVVDAFEQVREAQKAVIKQLSESEDWILKEIDSLSKQLDSEGE